MISTSAPAGLRLLRIGGDEVVRLVALQFDRLQPEGPDRLAHERHLDLQVAPARSGRWPL